MNEEIEYAEMLEIPVSTVSVTEKRRKFRKNKGDLKEKLISKVNGKTSGAANASAKSGEAYAYPAYSADFSPAENNKKAGDAAIAEAKNTDYAFDETALNRTYAQDFASGESFPDALTDESENFAPEGDNEKYYSAFSTVTIENEREESETAAPIKRKSKTAGKIIAAEFAAACLLCATIFMTNVFLPQSGMNVFFRSLSQKEETPVRKNYSDFTLQSVVSDFAEVPLSVSETGVLSFRGKCCVYPAVDGTLAAVTENENGTYDIKISHTEDFYGMICGLNEVYYAEGDKVYANIPVGYTRGEEDVQVTMYSGDQLLTSFTVNEQNCLSWVNS